MGNVSSTFLIFISRKERKLPGVSSVKAECLDTS